MNKYHLDDTAMEHRPQGPYYIAAEVDKRIAELEKVLRAECIFDVGQAVEQWYCSGCGVHADKPELIKHEDCRVAKALGL